MNPKFISVIAGILCLCNIGFAQESSKNKRHVLKNKHIYITYKKDKKVIEYFDKEKGVEDSEPITNDYLFEIKGSTTCNIYMEWLNPLQYAITFKDSIYEDPDIKILEDFLKLSYGRLNTTTNESPKSLDDLSNTNNKSGLLSTGEYGASFINDRTAFKDRDLRTLQLFILKTEFNSNEKNAIQNLYNDLKALDALHTDHLGNMKEDLNKLAKISEASEVKATVKAVEDAITEQNKNLTAVNKQLQQVSPLNLNLKDKFNQAHIVFSVEDYVEKIKLKSQVDSQGIKKMNEIIKTLNNSISSDNSDKDPKFEYFRVKQVQFDEDKHFKTSMTISKYEINADKLEITKQENVLNQTVIFKKFDPIKISVSTGIFFANFTLKGFGVSQGENELIVNEDNINTSTAIPATFLNFHFDFGSRTLLPLMQIGADPTQKRPFILLGGGFAIPKSKFAVTGGPIWTWEQTLDKLTVGGPVASTTDLEKDIKYTFDMAPKGWYLGVQFNF